jgi:hypothetical protein
MDMDCEESRTVPESDDFGDEAQEVLRDQGAALLQGLSPACRLRRPIRLI